MESDESVLQSFKDDNKVYVGDFSNGNGRYISRTFSVKEQKNEDLFVYSNKIDVRLTYIYEKNNLNGIKITKIKDGKKDGEVTLSGFDFNKLLATLEFFSELDYKSIANKSLILDQSIIKDSSDEIKRFIETFAADKNGQKALSELKNLTPTYIQEMSRRKKNLSVFEEILTSENAFQELKKKINAKRNEDVWQKLFENNDWMVGSDFVEILNERSLSEHETVDLPMKNVDGFYDIIELKLPDAQFWDANDEPTKPLISAISQCARYLRIAEKKSNDSDKLKELGCDIVKPRITLIYGRSNEWTDEQCENFRVLNSSLSNISVLTYDHVLTRAKRICGTIELKGREK